MLDRTIGLLAPHSCVGCGALGELLCSKCANSLNTAISRCYRCHKISENFRTCSRCRRESKLYSVAARTRYDGLAEKLVQQIKFGYARAGANDVAELVASLLPESGRLVITYLPTAPSRVRQRGFDQAKLIAKQLAAKAGLPYLPLLTRNSNERQVGSSRAERLENARKMFRVRSNNILEGKSVVLVDDVITTGASLEAAARVLGEAGAKRIYGLVFCQA